MNALRKIVVAAAASAALGVAAFAATPAAAQGWRYDQGPGWGGGWGQYRGYDYGSYGYGPYGYGYPGYGVNTGVTDFAICPDGYHLGRSGRLCWPD